MTARELGKGQAEEAARCSTPVTGRGAWEDLREMQGPSCHIRSFITQTRTQNLQAGFLEISFPSICPAARRRERWLTKRQIGKSWLTPPVLLSLCTQDCADHKEGIRGFLRLRQDLSFFLQTWPRLPKFLFLDCVKDLLRRGPQLRRGVMTCPQGL